MTTRVLTRQSFLAMLALATLVVASFGAVMGYRALGHFATGLLVGIGLFALAILIATIAFLAWLRGFLG